VDIKLKNKLLEWAKTIFIWGIGVLLCFVLYYLVDDFFNGSFVDWFDGNYMVTQYAYIEEAGQNGWIRRPDYIKIKMLLLWGLVLGVILWIASIRLSCRLYSAFKVRQSVTQISQMIDAFMNTDTSAAHLFPKECAEISAQMVEIKAAMQRHEQILKEEAARKNDLIAYLAHDLKTPLTSVIGYLSLLDEALDMPMQQRGKYVHITLDKARRLESLIDEFFEITRYNLQQIEIEKKRIDLCYMLVQLTDEFYPLLQQHGNSTELNVDEGMTVYGDAVKLARVFNNILKNAIAYSYPNSVIKIWAEQNDGNVSIYFQNKGKMIPSHKLDAIFEKFFRLDEARTTNTGGAGLGLAIAKEIVMLHGGSITAASKNEETTFCVSLPGRD
jgi:two-component system sensor histidine kinase VanS